MTRARVLYRPIIDIGLVDRWIYVVSAGLFLLTAIIGFAPRSAAILTGAQPNPPLVIHIRAAMMVSWLVLLLTLALAYDISRHGRPHSAFVIGLGLLLPWMIATHFLWNSPWWVETASSIMGAVSQE